LAYAAVGTAFRFLFPVSVISQQRPQKNAEVLLNFFLNSADGVDIIFEKGALAGATGKMASITTMKLEHLAGRQVGTSVLLRELARGGMAVIFLAYQKTLKRRIAVKILPKSLINEMSAEFFRQEAEAAAILSHPNIIPVYEVGNTDEFLFFTMQLVNGKSLAQYIKMAAKNPLPSKRFLPVGATLRIVTEVLDALDYAHQQEIIHRDIKSANILIESHTKRPIITDFGLAKVCRGPEANASMLLGTPTYMAPEQIQKAPVDPRTDIYATGTMLFEMLVSQLPFPKVNNIRELLKAKLALQDHLFQHRPSQLNPAVTGALDRIVQKATAFHPEERYGSAREFKADLEEYRARRLEDAAARRTHVGAQTH